MKLLLFISHNGGISRRDAFGKVRNGDVTVNGVVEREPSRAIDPMADKVMISGRAVNSKEYAYILLNKPAG